jgi:NAD(P)-dependent dehydrogenase (short-subunit alcohol dehydrogenase family)
MASLTSFSDGGGAAIIGASGAIGAALVRAVVDSERFEVVHALSRSASQIAGAWASEIDLEDDDSIARAAGRLAEGPPLRLLIVATGILHGPDFQPEKSIRQLDREAMLKILAVNTVGPAMLARHFLSLVPRQGRSVLAALSARVGSIGDNRLGGWHSYRASKAALNMVWRNLAIELGRTHPGAVSATLHPGTVDSGLSKPFQAGVAPEKLFTPAYSAERLLSVIDGLSPADSGGAYAWDGQAVPW